ncbi:MAG: hypothetical protein JSS98_18900, partial [Bacteroidetes bacterium]|nr:hypothetical protein [Bacteroidota bacterium]
PTPTLTATPISLSGFTYQSGYWASSPQSYNISGTNLTGFPGNIVVTPPTGYEVSSSSGGSYSASLNVPYSSATLTSTPVWVRLKSGLAIGTYSGNVANVGGGASTQNVALTGSVTKAVFTSVNTGFTDWYTGTTWDKGTVPGSGDDVVVNTGVYANSGITRDPGTATTITSSGNLGIGSGTYTNNGTTTVNGTFQINGGGYANGTDFKYASSGSTLIMNHNSGLYGINSGQTFWPSLNAPFNVTIDGTGAQLNSSAGAKTINGTLLIKSQFDINSSGLITVNGTLQINSGYISSNSPVYGNLSTLVYNTTYTPSLEWTGNSTTAGSGVPQNVTIQNSASISMPNSNRGMAGDLNINSGSLSLNGSSGDLYIAGNWTRALGATFTPNNRAVFFNGSGTQTVTVTGGGTENFDYLLVQNTSSLQLGSNTNINVNKPSGLTLSSTASTTIDLNGRTMALTGGGNLNIGASARNINSTVAGGVFNISGNTVTVTGSGSLTYGANTNLKLNNGLNCGTGSLVTVNNQLEIASGGYVTGNSPRYGSGSLLLYTAGDISPAYQRRLEWTSNAIAPAGTPGLPYHVQISNGTILNFISGTAGQMGMLGNLTIDKTPTPAALYMDYGGASLGGALTVMGNVTVNGNMSLGYSSGDDLKTEGDLTFGSGYAFTTNNRAIYFTKNGTQNIYTPSSAALTLPKIILGKVSGTGTTLNMNQDLTLAANASGWDVLVFTNTSDVLNINNKTHTIGQSGYNNTVSGLGSFKGSTTSNLTLLGTGNVGTLNFASGGTVLNNFTIDRTGGALAATLGSVLTINSQLTLTNGYLNIAGKNLYFNLAASVGGTPATNSFVQADGAGQVIKNFNSSYTSFTYPIGDATGTVEYSPAKVSFNSGTYSSATVGVNVVNGKHINNISTSYLKRYWNITSNGISAYNANLTFNYLATDVVGTEADLLTGGWDGTFWYLSDPANIGLHTLTVTGETALKGAYTGVDLNVTQLASSASDYFRSNGNGDWATAGTWQSSPTGTGYWHTATSAPTSSAKGIEVLGTDSVAITSNAT